MAKKSTAARQPNAVRRTQTPTKTPEVALVRPPKAADTADTTTTVASGASAPASTSATVKPSKTPVSVTAERPRAPEVNRVAAKPAPKMESQGRSQSAKAQESRLARARATQQSRTVNRVSPEHYSYVLNDLKLIAVLAVLMFAVIIILHFVLPA